MQKPDEQMHAHNVHMYAQKAFYNLLTKACGQLKMISVTGCYCSVCMLCRTTQITSEWTYHLICGVVWRPKRPNSLICT